MVNNQILYLQVEPTTRCNFKCKFCCGRKMQMNDMELGTFRKIITSFTDLRHLQLQGEGEPLLSKDLFEMIKLTKKYHRQAKISITMNGSLLTNGAIKQIIDLDIFSVLVSIESQYPDKFEYLRGGDLNKIKTNLSNFVNEKKKRKRKNPILGFAVMVMNDTFDEFKRIIDLYKELELDGEFTIQYLQTMKIYVDVYDEEMKKQIPSKERIRDFQREIKNDHEIWEFVTQHTDVGGFFDELYGSIGKDKWECPWLNAGMNFTSHGDATGCSYIKNTEKGFGNIKNTSVNEIISRQKKAADQMSHGIIPVSCIDCHEIPL